MKEPLYRDAVRFGWTFAWKNKFLWIYGLLAALLGQLGMFDMLGKTGRAIAHAAAGEVRLDFFRFPGGRMLPGISQFVGNPGLAWLLWVFILGAGVAAALTVLAVVSQGALIHAAARGKHGKDLPADSREWHAGVAHFWRLLFLNALKKITIILLSVLVGWAAYAAALSSGIGDFFLFLALFVLCVAVGMAVSFFVLYAACYVVIEEHGLADALQSAWALLKQHWLVSLEVGCVFLILNMLLAAAGMLGFFLLLVPATLLWFLAFFIGNSVLFGIGMVFLLFCFIAFVMALGAVFTVFSTTTWTHLFLHMHRYGVRSRLMHWLKG
jgi:hypothetical protein